MARVLKILPFSLQNDCSPPPTPPCHVDRRETSLVCFIFFSLNSRLCRLYWQTFTLILFRCASRAKTKLSIPSIVGDELVSLQRYRGKCRLADTYLSLCVMKKRNRWNSELIVAMLAVAIGVCTMFVYIYQARIMSKQIQASTWAVPGSEFHQYGRLFFHPRKEQRCGTGHC